jgi:beta-fructofuranosidase
MYYKGRYHLFYQYNPKGAVWADIVWAHSVSRDLVNWEELEPAIRPSIKADQYGCWSGSATMLPDSTPVIMYTGIILKINDSNYQVQNLAYPRNKSDPLLREWIKPADNPVIVPEPGMNATLFRDPTTAWRANGLWHLVIGSREGTTQGVAYLYRSHDFKQWTRVRRPLHSAPTGMWECPDFYPVMVGGWKKGVDTSVSSSSQIKHVLKNSLDARRYDYYTVGSYDRRSEQYVPDNPEGDEHHLRYDNGNFYASKTFYDPSKRRRILWGWANESDTVADDLAKGWAGIQVIAEP